MAAGVCLRACMNALPDRPRRLLSPHPTSPPVPVREIGISARREGDALLLHYRLLGDLDSLALPEPRLPVRADNLWRHTCFEAFVGRVGSAEYREYNFAPSGAWAAYHFDAYRAGMRTDQWIVVPGVTTRRDDNAFVMDAMVDIRWLTASAGGAGAVRLGVTAVIEDKAGALSYWALRHPAEKPDFHHADSFVLELG
jgi:hypothetical protein